MQPHGSATSLRPFLQVRLSGELVAWVGGSGVYLDDLTTGKLVQLGRLSSAKSLLAFPRIAGRYVLWYDDNGGHVGKFTG